MKLIVMPVIVAALCGCTSTLLIDATQGDVFQYKYTPWQNQDIEEASQRVRYWCYEGPRHYDTNKVVRLDLRLYVDETNLIKKASYEFRCNAEAEARTEEP